MSLTQQKISALKSAAKSSPEYADIVPLFAGIYEYLLGREKETGISIELSVTDMKERLENSFPLINAIDLKVDRERSVVFLRGLIAVLTSNGKENAEFLQSV